MPRKQTTLVESLAETQFNQSVTISHNYIIGTNQFLNVLEKVVKTNKTKMMSKPSTWAVKADDHEFEASKRYTAKRGKKLLEIFPGINTY